MRFSFHPEFRVNVGLYDPEKDFLERIQANTDGIMVKILCADWCPDSRMQLPRFLSAILALSHRDFDIEFIDVDRNKEDEEGEARKQNVFAIPTFIFIHDGEEIGRIIERPKESMEKDILEIMGKEENAPAGI